VTIFFLILLDKGEKKVAVIVRNLDFVNVAATLGTESHLDKPFFLYKNRPEMFLHVFCAQLRSSLDN
jgi:hypothetical protein